MLKETDLYPPLYAYLENLGYEVKAEIKHCDVVARRAAEPPLIVELKTVLNFELILQAADRLNISESVYIAFPAKASLWRKHWRRVRGLCRRLGVGIITFEGQALKVKIRLDPVPYKPQGSSSRRQGLLAEFEGRVGDNNVGGSTRQPIMTAYRQAVLRCVMALQAGECSLAEIRGDQSIKKANRIMQNNYYGWFERVRRGYYQLSPKGLKALEDHAEMIAQL